MVFCMNAGLAVWPYDADVRQILGSQDFPENPQKSLFATFSDAAEKPSKNPPPEILKNPQKTLPRPLKPSKNPPRRHF